jgi:hypothetical protein
MITRQDEISGHLFTNQGKQYTVDIGGVIITGELIVTKITKGPLVQVWGEPHAATFRPWKIESIDPETCTINLYENGDWYTNNRR